MVSSLRAVVAGLATCSLFFDTSSARAATPIAVPICPPMISVTQTITGPLPPDWTVRHTNVGHLLNNIGFLAGDLVANPELIPRTVTLTFSTQADVWDFLGDGDELWIDCSHTATKLELYARLPPGTGSCETVSSDVSCAPAH